MSNDLCSFGNVQQTSYGYNDDKGLTRLEVKGEKTAHSYVNSSTVRIAHLQ